MKVGFSYTPENLQKAGISCYNFHWEDLTNPNMSEVMKNVKFMDMHISKGEAVLVHCHAGQGRTGVVIAAYLMYSNTTETVDETVEYIRSKRIQWLKKGYNRKFLHHIKSKFDENRQMFPTEKRPTKLTLKDIIKKQEVMFHGDERIKQKLIPKVMDVCLVSVLWKHSFNVFNENNIPYFMKLIKFIGQTLSISRWKYLYSWWSARWVYSSKQFKGEI